MRSFEVIFPTVNDDGRQPEGPAFNPEGAFVMSGTGNGSGGPARGMPGMWEVIRRSIADAWALARREKGIVALLLVIELLIGSISLVAGKASTGPGFAFVSAALSQLLALPFTLRFCGLLLQIDRPDVLAPSVWSRLAGWGAFCVILGIIADASALPWPLPAPVALSLMIGASYFQARLLPLYPALMRWPNWPGIDRVWTPSGRFVLPLFGCAIVVYTPVVMLVMLVLVILTRGSHAGNDPVAATAHIQQWLEPMMPVVAALMAILTTAATLFWAAMRVRLFRLIAD